MTSNIAMKGMPMMATERHLIMTPELDLSADRRLEQYLLRFTNAVVAHVKPFEAGISIHEEHRRTSLVKSILSLGAASPAGRTVIYCLGRLGGEADSATVEHILRGMEVSSTTNRATRPMLPEGPKAFQKLLRSMERTHLIELSALAGIPPETGQTVRLTPLGAVLLPPLNDRHTNFLVGRIAKPRPDIT